MLCGGESGHVGSGLGDDDVGGVPTDAGDGADQVSEAAKGFHHHLDSVGEPFDGRGVLVDQIQVHAGQKRGGRHRGAVHPHPAHHLVLDLGSNYQRHEHLTTYSHVPGSGQLPSSRMGELQRDVAMRSGVLGPSDEEDGQRRTQTLADFPTRCNSLNFLRLVFAVLVIISHAWPIGRFGPDPKIGQFTLGHFAVAGFFALSGWLITQSRMSSELPSYLWRRFCRIYPGYFVVLVVVAFAFSPLGAAVSSGTYSIPDGVRYVGQNLSMYTRHYLVGASLPATAEQAWNGSLWTLIHEVGCYVVIGLMVTVVGRRRIGLFVVTGFVVLTVLAVTHMFGFPAPGVLVAFVGLAPFFFAGAVLFVLRNRIPLRVYYAALAAGMITFVCVTSADSVLAAVPIAYLSLWLGARLPSVFRRIGRRNDISYGIYIYAFPVQQLIALLGGAGLGVALYAGVSVVATVPFAVVSWFVVERPAQHWGRKLDRFPFVRSGFRVKRRSDAAASGESAAH
jgi:peptidoglycan/LPS O-acetylase OafA/YrhL